MDLGGFLTQGGYLLSQFSLVQYLEFFARILVACACGAAIGFERSKRFKEAGIRTHIIVCAAAALMMIVSKYGFADLTDAAGNMFNGTHGADYAPCTKSSALDCRQYMVLDARKSRLALRPPHCVLIFLLTLTLRTSFAHRTQGTTG